MKKLVMLVAVFGVAVVLSACGTSSVSGEAARTIAGQVADYDGPAGTLAASIYGVAAELGTGSISADGNFTFVLNDTVPSEALFSPEACDGLTRSNPEAKALIVTELAVMSAGKAIGYLTLTDKKPGPDLTSSTLTMRMYVDRSTTIQGTCATGTSKETANLDLKKGWNVVSGEVSSDEADRSSETRLYSGPAANVEWFYSASGFGGDDIVDTSPDTSNEISGRVLDYGGPAGTLEATAGNSDTRLGTGEIDSKGVFFFELEPTVAEAALEPVSSFEACSDIAVSDRQARLAAVVQLDVMTDDYAGTLFLTDLNPADQTASYTVVGRFYADRDVSVQGECTDTGYSLDLDLQRGWNVVTVRFEESANPHGSYSYESGDLPGTRWYYSPAN